VRLAIEASHAGKERAARSVPEKAEAGRSRASAPSVRLFCSSSSVAVKSKRHDERSALLESVTFNYK